MASSFIFEISSGDLFVYFPKASISWSFFPSMSDGLLISPMARVTSSGRNCNNNCVTGNNDLVSLYPRYKVSNSPQTGISLIKDMNKLSKMVTPNLANELLSPVLSLGFIRLSYNSGNIDT